jgi:hypothetical protein
MSLGVSDVTIVDTALMAQLTIIGAGLGLQPEQRSVRRFHERFVMIRGVHCVGELVPGLSG